MGLETEALAPMPDYRRWTRGCLFAAWTAFIFAMTLVSDPAEKEGIGWVASVLREVGISDFCSAKAFHLAAYALWMWLLAGLVSGGYLRPIGRWQVGLVLCALALMSATQESLQFLSSTRHPALFDVGVNIMGGLLCLALRPRACLLLAQRPSA